MLHWFAKRLREMQEVRREERGFTLIELLVVVIIIGILAAIAIPVFLNQRARAWDAAAKSDVRNMATAEEGYFAANDSYTDDWRLLQPQGFRPSAGVTGHSAILVGNGYCVHAKSQSDQDFKLNSTGAGVPETGTCP